MELCVEGVRLDVVMMQRGQYLKEETYRAPLEKQKTDPEQGTILVSEVSDPLENSQERRKIMTQTISELNPNTIKASALGLWVKTVYKYLDCASIFFLQFLFVITSAFPVIVYITLATVDKFHVFRAQLHTTLYESSLCQPG